jgi:hypothetical protein
MRRVRVLTLILVGYLFLDIANPMMPGAVQLVDGVIQVVQAVQAARTWIGAEPPCQTMLLHASLALPPNRLSRPLRPLRHISRRPRRCLLRPRFPAPQSASSADDH